MAIRSLFGNRNARTRAIDLGKMSPLRFAQHQQWHELFIRGPTRSVVGERGNDFPGFYYYDPRTQTEHVGVVTGRVDWRHSCIDRRIVKNKNGPHQLVVGLFSDARLGPGVKLEHWHAKRVLLVGQDKKDRDAMPGQWEALRTLVDESYRLMPLPNPDPPYDWERVAAQCLETLQKVKHKQTDCSGDLIVFFETFRGSRSSYSREPEPDKEYRSTAELICQAGLAAELLAYASTNPKNASAFRDLGLQLGSTLDRFYDRKTGFFLNTYPPKGEEWRRGVVDTWYSLNNLYQVLRVAKLANNEGLAKLALKATERLISFVRACRYQIPLFAKLGHRDGEQNTDGEVIGYALNPSVLGMYAAVLVRAAERVPAQAKTYLSEAHLALQHLRRWPLAMMHHQTVQLSWAAMAAHDLGEANWRDDFVRCLLLNCYREGEHAGLFQGCAGLRYPAFRECVEAIEPWAQWLGDSPQALPLRTIMGHVLSKLSAFMFRKGKSQGLPKEGLATLEQPNASRIGTAIYAAPQVFALARLQVYDNAAGGYGPDSQR